VSLARALSLEPEIILMDEPFSALDPNTRRVLRSQLVQLWKDIGMTIIFVTHDIEEALELGDRVIVLGTRPSKVEKIVSPKEKRPREVDMCEELRNIKKDLIKLFENLAITKVN
jgi:NitT/TauT family transport system ATP-binding protein